MTTGGDKTARVWDVATGRQLMTLVGHASPVSIVATLPDNGRAVTAGSDGTIRLWDLTTGEELRQYAGHATNLEIAGGKLDDLVNQMRSATIADRRAGVKAHEIDDSLADYRRSLLRPATPLALAVDPCGARFVTGSQDRTARIWDTATGKELLQLVGHTRAVWDARFLPDGQRVITAGADRTIRVWDANTGRQLGSLATPSVVHRLRLSADGRSVVCGCEDQLLWLEVGDGERRGRDDSGGPIRARVGGGGRGRQDHRRRGDADHTQATENGLPDRPGGIRARRPGGGCRSRRDPAGLGPRPGQGPVRVSRGARKGRPPSSSRRTVDTW